MKNKQLIESITKRAKADQKLRARVQKGGITNKEWNKVLKLDEQNIKFVKKTIDKYGWPTFDLIGKRASHYFWLLVQHADKDIKLQKKALQSLKEEVSRGQAYARNFAYLTDRVLTAESKKQVYGTQFIVKGKKLVVKPVRNMKKVNQLRKSASLTPLGVATRKINKEYSGFLRGRK
ncbi:MAG: DUF6624 domain-containing protein [Candidatus Komeilibacteria bacterium]